MIVLEQGETLQIYSGSAPPTPDLDCVVSWWEGDCSKRGNQLAKITAESTGDGDRLLDGPTPPAVWRGATWISVRNAGDGENDVAIILADGSDEYDLWRATLAQGDVLIYDGGLWRILRIDGIVVVRTLAE